MILLYSLVIIFILAFGINYFIWKNRLKDKMNLELDWQKFLKSESLNDIKGISLNGERLIWNKYLKSEQLHKIIEVVNARINNFPELKKLENNAYNKKLYYDRNLPYIGSSGGKKQSW